MKPKVQSSIQNPAHAENGGDSWKEMAGKIKTSSSKLGPTMQHAIIRMNELWPFSTALGVLDNGCGSGSIVTHVLETYGAEIPRNANIIAGDYSEPMLDILRGKRRKETETSSNDCWTRLEIRNLDAHDLSSIPEGSISHITGGHLYFLLSDPRQALRETNRVLSQGGVLAISSGKSSQHIDALCDAVEAVRPGTNLKLFAEPWASEDGVRGELEATDFVDLEISLHPTELKYDDHESFADMLLSMPVMRTATQGYSEPEVQALCKYVIDNLKKANPASPGVLKGVGIAAVARKRN